MPEAPASTETPTENLPSPAEEKKEVSPQEALTLLSFDHLSLDEFWKTAKDEMDKEKQTIASDSDLTAKANALNSIVDKTKAIRSKANEITVKNWLQIGRILIVLRDEVPIKLGQGHWEQWVAQNLHISKSRVEDAIDLACWGPSLEKYFFLGIERLLKFVSRLKKYGHTEEFKLAAKTVGFSATTDVTTPEAQKEVKEQVDTLNSTVINTNYSDTLLSRALTIKCKDMKRHKIIVSKMSTEQEKLDYLQRLIANRGQGMSVNDTIDDDMKRQESLNSVLSKLDEIIDGYIERGTYPFPLDEKIVHIADSKITRLKHRIEQLHNIFSKAAGKLTIDIKP